MEIFHFVLVLLHISFAKGALSIRKECTIVIVNVAESQTISLLGSADGEVMWLCAKDPGAVFNTTISLKSGSLSPLTPVFSLPDNGVWYNLTVGQEDDSVPKAAYILVNGKKQSLGDDKIDYVNVIGECTVAWASCPDIGHCPFSSSTKSPSKSSSCPTSESELVTTTPHPSHSPWIDPTSKGAVPTLSILLVMALLIILLLSINNCRLMWLLRSKENLNHLSIGSESRFCQEHCNLLERHQHNGILQCTEKVKVQPKHSFQAVNTHISLVQDISTEDLTSVVEINASRLPEENEIPAFQTSQQFVDQSSALIHNPRNFSGNSSYGSTRIV